MKKTPERILYVEDEPNIQAVARMALEDIGGFRVDVANSGLEGLEMARNGAPDLILLDAMMPGLDGFGTFRALKQDPSTRSIPVVFMTAKVQSHEIASYLELGALAVIPKPFDPMTLSDELRELWRRHYGQPS
ncbi:MAG: response regulator [Planctomycetes bacterium]|nr:response regulator [Planctomycetota bacterium]